MTAKSSAGSRANKANAGDVLSRLLVLDELRVGQARLEKRRVSVTYTAVRGKHRDSVDLVYRYAEDVFTPGDLVDTNLGNMMGAQVALNYGLFAKKIVFEGAFDAVDQRFLSQMADNTAREIYVKKFLEPNPFLPDDLVEQPAVKQKHYLQSELVFVGDEKRTSWQSPAADSSRVAVLSSGGKDSLLSYGLLNELGYDVHPVFGNESGRHWFTALNAFRYFSDTVPHTTRVWMNSDRVFSWMLRQLPFVRADFARVRSDEYPVRLWTVAVFLFGALPLARKRGVGRIVIGDEFDTTARGERQKIPHYNGLYDQSRYFDDAMTRYFVRKGWVLHQFSLLRQCSELLIQQTLAERYPRLLQQQMSCHAAHTEGDRVLPCGRCEKCRRIVGMLRAVGASPAACGYSPEQVDSCMTALVEQGVHQERPGSEHLMWLLARNGLVPTKTKHAQREHPEIMKLRFDGDKSSVEGIPEDIREPLYNVLLQTAQGAVQRSGGTWKAFDVLKDPGLTRPYPFEKQEKISVGKKSSDQERYLLGEMSWPQAQARLKEVDVALLPVGATEQHGHHLPLDTDSFDALYLAEEVARACKDPKPLVLPLVPYGVSYHHDDFPGTISIGNNTLAQMIYEIGMSAARNGITKLVVINGHGGNAPALNFAAQEINRDAHIFVAVDTGETSDVDVYDMIDTPNDVHAGEIETSTSLATRPELVDMKRAKKLVPEFSSAYLGFTSKRGVPWYAFTKRISESGVMGDPTKATAEKGTKMWAVMTQHLTTFVEQLKVLTLDEIYQKRY